MDILLSILTVLFVALVLAAAFTFGFVLLIWFTFAALVASLVVMGHSLWRRWWFLRQGVGKKPDVIEVDYRDISDEE